MTIVLSCQPCLAMLSAPHLSTQSLHLLLQMLATCRTYESPKNLFKGLFSLSLTIQFLFNFSLPLTLYPPLHLSFPLTLHFPLLLSTFQKRETLREKEGILMR